MIAVVRRPHHSDTTDDLPDGDRSPLRTVASWALTSVMVATILFLWPSRLGGSTDIVVVTGRSMEPTYGAGDVLVVRSAESYRIGDIVVFAAPDGLLEGELVVHRIVDVGAAGELVTRGDNNASADAWKLTTDDIVGRPVLRIPHGDRVLALLRNQVTIGLLAGVVTVVALWPRRREDRSDPPPSGHADSPPSRPTEQAFPPPSETLRWPVAGVVTRIPEETAPNPWGPPRRPGCTPSRRPGPGGPAS